MTQDDVESNGVSYKFRFVIDRQTWKALSELKLKASMTVVDYLSNLNAPKGLAIRTMAFIIFPDANIMLFMLLQKFKFF